MDHGTTGISFAIMNDRQVLDVFKISREDSKAGKVSAIEELSKRVDLDDIELMIITYAMGDGISTILPIERVENRGILSINGAGKVTGGGTSVYSEIENSNLPVLMIPGIHKNCEWLDPLFRAAYSHHASPEKISIVYNAYLETNWENMIVADISSNSVDLLVEDGIIKAVGEGTAIITVSFAENDDYAEAENKTIKLHIFNIPALASATLSIKISENDNSSVLITFKSILLFFNFIFLTITIQYKMIETIPKGSVITCTAEGIPTKISKRFII